METRERKTYELSSLLGFIEITETDDQSVQQSLTTTKERANCQKVHFESWSVRKTQMHTIAFKTRLTTQSEGSLQMLIDIQAVQEAEHSEVHYVCMVFTQLVPCLSRIKVLM